MWVTIFNFLPSTARVLKLVRNIVSRLASSYRIINNLPCHGDDIYNRIVLPATVSGVRPHAFLLPIPKLSLLRENKIDQRHLIRKCVITISP